MPRVRPIEEQVTIWLDDEPIPAERGEPVAAALVAAGHLALARSPKFHRPRGPSCMRASCDGCLARVDGIPNVMTCRVPSSDGLRVETQNVVGWRERDLLRVTDWLFPRGMNHHELMAGVPVARSAVEAIARQVAGLGKLPDRDLGLERPRPARRRTVDVLVVGAGPSGMASAVELARRGRAVEVVDEDSVWGRTASALDDPARPAQDRWKPLLETFASGVAPGASGISVTLSSTIVGIYGDDVLCRTPAGLDVLTARTLVLAPGAHDGVLAFEGNDLPGILSARAACTLLACGVRPGTRAVVVACDEPSVFAEAYARGDPSARIAFGVPLRAHGVRQVRGLTLRTAEGEERVPCDCLIIDAPRAPAYELCAQAGATLEATRRGFRVQTGPGSRIGTSVFAVGEAAGTPLDPAAVSAEAAQLGA
ncbi:MAG: 2Fe-2S iron-sulfur cluster-binding protein [Polyangiaceae bacterium]|nr:2Fe-2S iron-sulfur cluster-binding protein [Polyangiaceae bacterium]